MPKNVLFGDSNDINSDTKPENENNINNNTNNMPYRLRFGKFRSRKEEIERRNKISNTKLP